MVEFGVFNETAPFAVAVSPDILTAFRGYGLTLLQAVRPWDEGVDRLLGQATDAGVRVWLWPMLDDRQGRWLSPSNERAFMAFAERIAAWRPQGVVLDVEPPIQILKSLLRGNLARLRDALRVQRSMGSSIASHAVAALREQGIPVRWVVPPFPPALLGISVDDDAEQMLYSSLLEGWSHGLLRRDDTACWVYAHARRLVQCVGARAAVSLGVIGTGAFETEPLYRHPGELAADVGLARAAGVGRISLFDLGGMLARPPWERWVEAALGAHPPKEPPKFSRRARLVCRLEQELDGVATTWAVSSPYARHGSDLGRSGVIS